MNNYQYYVSEFLQLDTTQAKKLYLQLAHKYHPDIGGDNQTMQHINTAYQNYLKHNRTGEIKDNQDEIDLDLINKINKIVQFSDLEIELLGVWIWVTGNTKDRKDTLKENGFFFSSKKTAWYYRKEQNKKSYRNGNFSLDEIREKHGTKFEKRTAKLSKTIN